MREIARQIILNMNLAHVGSWDTKILAISKLSFIPAFIVFSFERLTTWYIDNHWFMQGVLIAIAIDHILGTYVHFWIKRDWSWKKNISGLFTKLIMCILGYIIFEFMHVIVQPVDFIAHYFSVVLQLMVFLYPGLSALGNMSVITKGKFPPVGWIDKLNQFNNSGDLEHLRTKKENYEDITERN